VNVDGRPWTAFAPASDVSVRPPSMGDVRAFGTPRALNSAGSRKTGSYRSAGPARSIGTPRSVGTAHSTGVSILRGELEQERSKRLGVEAECVRLQKKLSGLCN